MFCETQLTMDTRSIRIRPITDDESTFKASERGAWQRRPRFQVDPAQTRTLSLSVRGYLCTCHLTMGIRRGTMYHDLNTFCAT